MQNTFFFSVDGLDTIQRRVDEPALIASCYYLKLKSCHTFVFRFHLYADIFFRSDDESYLLSLLLYFSLLLTFWFSKNEFFGPYTNWSFSISSLHSSKILNPLHLTVATITISLMPCHHLHHLKIVCWNLHSLLQFSSFTVTIIATSNRTHKKLRDNLL